VLVLGVLLLQLGLAAWVPPTADELYYWCWSRDLQLSYFDHAPLTAYLIRLSTMLFGDNAVALRLPACLCMFAELLLLGRLVRPLSIMGWVLLTPPCCLAGILITPDAPLLCFWTAYVVWLTALHQRLAADDRPTISRWVWIGGGILLGLGILSKYTMVFAGAAGGLSLLAVQPWRKWRAGFVAHGVVAAVLASPIVLFNLQWDFAPLRFQWRHGMSTHSANMLYPLEFIGGQVMGVGWLPFGLAPWLIWNWRRLSLQPRLSACLYLFLVPFVFFLYKSTRGHMEVNWAVVCYVAFWPLAANWFEEMRSRKVLRVLAHSSFLLPVGVTLFLACHFVSPLPLVPPRNDRLTRFASWYTMSQQISASIQQVEPQTPVFAATYQITAYLRYQHIQVNQIAGASRPSHFTQRTPPLEEQDRFLLVTDGPLAAELVRGFSVPEVVAEFPVLTRGQETERFLLLRYVKKGPGA
jgi:4-amino-4-deoxy-L-arabinose transferase-like glycosyltransferase